MIARLCLLLAAQVAASAQPSDAHAFEVASLKPSDPTHPGGSFTFGDKTELTIRNMPLHRLIENAYGVFEFQVAAPDWTNNERFDVVGKFPAGTPQAEQQLMLRTLIAGRFHLVAHMETRPAPGYSIVVAKSGARLKPSDSVHSSIGTKPGRRITEINAHGSTIEQFAHALTVVAGSVVTDDTGLSGRFDIDLKYAPENAPEPTDPSAPALPSLFAAMQEQLGLRLQPRKVPADVVVVDHVDRTPAEN